MLLWSDAAGSGTCAVSGPLQISREAGQDHSPDADCVLSTVLVLRDNSEQNWHGILILKALAFKYLDSGRTGVWQCSPAAIRFNCLLPTPYWFLNTLYLSLEYK